ncbi:MAG: hypothetical protein KGL39_51705, partial [Patescibacteria group bacterium]|nr:hypothetical protein [Patescibacteria group bacterium]
MITLFVNTYRDPDPVRDAELEAVRSFNRGNSAIATTVDLIGPRLAFGELFREVNLVGHDQQVVVVANADIYFDQSIAAAADIAAGHAYALTRWDDCHDGIRLFADEKGTPRCDSQDAWIFRAPIRPELIEACNFTLGVRGCDNRLAYEIAKAGYTVSNQSKSIRA